MNEFLMRSLAAHHAEVMVSMPDGQQRHATLMAWRPSDGRSRARVRFRTGALRSVDAEQVSPICYDVHSPTNQPEGFRHGT